jgi:quinol monooxygenase YgiN
MIHVLAIITTLPGRRGDVLELCRANVPAVLAEEGCLEYGPAIDSEGAGALQTPVGPDTFVVIEKWSSMQALEAHSRAPHMKAYAEKVRDLLADRVIHVLSPAEAISS